MISSDYIERQTKALSVGCFEQTTSSGSGLNVCHGEKIQNHHFSVMRCPALCSYGTATDAMAFPCDAVRRFSCAVPSSTHRAYGRRRAGTRCAERVYTESCRAHWNSL